MEQTRRPRGRPRKDEAPASLEESLAAALRAFAVHGFHGVSVRMLNRELGVSHNLLHQRWGSKEEIWRAAVDWGFGHLTTALRQADDERREPLERLRTYVRTFVRYSADHPELLRLMDIEGAEHSDRLDYIFDNYISPEMDRVTNRLLDALENAGTMRPVPRIVIYYMITSGGAGMFARRALSERIFGADVLEPDHLDRHADTITDFIINALLDDRDRAAGTSARRRSARGRP